MFLTRSATAIPLYPLFIFPFAFLASPASALPQAGTLEEVRVVGRRDVLLPSLGAGTTDLIAFDEQVSMNRTVGDWLEQLPGVSLNGQGGLFQAYSIRGFSRWRVRTELNGVPIITDRRAGNSASFVPPDLIAQVAVNKSASSTLYGSGAMGGVVNLDSRIEEGRSLRAEGASNGGQFALTALSGNPGGLSAGLSVRKAEDSDAPDGRKLNTAFEQVAATVTGSSELGSLSLDYRWLGSVSRDVGKSNALFPERRISSYPSDDHSVTQLELRADGDWFIRAYHHLQDWEADVERVGERRNLTSYRAHTVGGLFQANTRLLSGEGSVGAEWVGRRGVAIDDEEFTPDGTLLIEQALVRGEEDTVALFADQQWRLGAMEISGGMRYDHMDQSSRSQSNADGQWSASAAVDYGLGDSWTLRGELASGFRFPGLSERYFNGTTPRGEVLGNPDLEAETRRSGELALQFAPLVSTLKAGAAVYYSDLEDYIERYPVGPELVSYRNLDGASIQGLELDVGFQTGVVHHRLSYQWQEGEDDEGNTLADLNPPSLRYFFSWEQEQRGFYSDLSYRESREEFGADELPLASAVIWNARFTQRVARRWQAELFLSNILDEEYRSTADDVAPLQPGRTFGIRLEWRES
ncbi:TonB-dependent receptor plug domain-containing protein [Congregibacter litoralis]|uniref:Outer membrane cobalamin receptor protein n=1 Tax=Congregibacter litoralis KT71 TaxID=314285 RepID=A4AAT4_9GAMM|nr:TonB-dependent receptor [Congregibacter litoralis]EAQ96806.2 Outer membrane cobalamin receptor protein [Congregibacter litoralis KT71]